MNKLKQFLKWLFADEKDNTEMSSHVRYDQTRTLKESIKTKIK